MAREMCVGAQTLHNRKSKYGGMEFSDAKKPRALKDQNRRVKQPGGGASLSGWWNAFRATGSQLLSHVYRRVAASTSLTSSSRRNGLERNPVAPRLIAFSRFA